MPKLICHKCYPKLYPNPTINDYICRLHQTNKRPVKQPNRYTPTQK